MDEKNESFFSQKNLIFNQNQVENKILLRWDGALCDFWAPIARIKTSFCLGDLKSREFNSVKKISPSCLDKFFKVNELSRLVIKDIIKGLEINKGSFPIRQFLVFPYYKMTSSLFLNENEEICFFNSIFNFLNNRKEFISRWTKDGLLYKMVMDFAEKFRGLSRISYICFEKNNLWKELEKDQANNLSLDIFAEYLKQAQCTNLSKNKRLYVTENLYQEENKIHKHSIWHNWEDVFSGDFRKGMEIRLKLLFEEIKKQINNDIFLSTYLIDAIPWDRGCIKKSVKKEEEMISLSHQKAIKELEEKAVKFAVYCEKTSKDKKQAIAMMVEGWVDDNPSYFEFVEKPLHQGKYYYGKSELKNRIKDLVILEKELSKLVSDKIVNYQEIKKIVFSLFKIFDVLYKIPAMEKSFRKPYQPFFVHIINNQNRKWKRYKDFFSQAETILLYFKLFQIKAAIKI